MRNFKNCALIVAHPDDETLWAGGTVLINPEVNWEIISLCRKSDEDRNPKFFKSLMLLEISGILMMRLNKYPLNLARLSKLFYLFSEKKNMILLSLTALKASIQNIDDMRRQVTRYYL